MKLVLLASGKTVDWTPSGGTQPRGHARVVAALEHENQLRGNGTGLRLHSASGRELNTSGAAPDLTGGPKLPPSQPSASVGRQRIPGTNMQWEEDPDFLQARRAFTLDAMEEWNAAERAGKHNHGLAEMTAFQQGIEAKLADWVKARVARMNQGAA